LEQLLQLTGCYLKAGVSFLQVVTGMLLRISNDFKEASRKIILNFFNKKQPNIVKIISADTTQYRY
jgi:hypothetical protein